MVWWAGHQAAAWGYGCKERRALQGGQSEAPLGCKQEGSSAGLGVLELRDCAARGLMEATSLPSVLLPRGYCRGAVLGRLQGRRALDWESWVLGGSPASIQSINIY